MGWASEFQQALAGGGYAPLWLLRCVRSPFGGASGVYSSSQALGAVSAIVAAPSVAPARVTPVTWAPSFGSWSVQIQGDPHDVIQTAPRGSVVELCCSFDGTTAGLQPVALGVVRGVSGGPHLFTVTCWDLFTALRGRLTTTVGEQSLFHDVETATTLTAAYAPLDVVLDVTDATALQREAGKTGVVKVTPNTGGDFYLTYTGVTGNRLTGVSLTAQFGTTAAAANIGNAAANVAYLKGHPIDIARKVLCSGGGGGAYDTLPDSWGMAVLDAFVDHGDCDAWRDTAAVVDAGGYEWEVIQEAPAVNAYAWLAALLARGAFWLTTRQGRITLRCAQNHADPKLPFVETITESDVVSVDSWDLVDSSFTAEYSRATVVGPTTGTTIYASKGVETFPAQEKYEYDLSEVAWSNESELKAEVGRRVRNWCWRPLESFTVTCRGWRLAGLTSGDPLRLQLPRLTGRLTAYSQSYSAHRATVAEVAPNWNSHTARIKFWPGREA